MRKVHSSIAGMLALAGFAVAAVSSYAVGGDLTQCLLAGLVAMPACYLVGTMISAAASVAIEEHVIRVTQTSPVPDVEEEAMKLDAAGTKRGVS